MGTRLLIGLGNPGPEYDWTPHNLGFHVLEYLARREGLLFEPATSLEDFDGPRAFRCARSFDPDALLVEPETWMNRSGDVVLPLLRWCDPHADEPLDMMVVYDDLDLELGRLRIRPHGGTGGHKGMESIVSRLGTDRFPRLRVGIGKPGTDAARHVLTRLTGESLTCAERAVAEAADAAGDWLLHGDVDRCMTRFHSRWNQGPGDRATRTQPKEDEE